MIVSENCNIFLVDLLGEVISSKAKVSVPREPGHMATYCSSHASFPYCAPVQCY